MTGTVDRPPLRRYRGHISDSERWQRFATRADDVVITTPSKCGTTWMQTIVGMLLLGRVELGAPISTISPWLDMLVQSDEEVFGILDRQTHRRFIKSHTPLDGLPLRSTMTYIAVVRHPLDVALSDRDHGINMRADRAMELRNIAVGEPDPDTVVRTRPPEDPAEYLRWFIDNDEPPSGSGPHGLRDYCHQVLTYWDAREAPNVHLFHYADLWADLDGQMRRVADALGVAVDESRWPAFTEGATLSSMRARAADTAPNAHQGLWESPEKFFHTGGTRAWASLLTAADITHFKHRMHELAGDAAAWALEGQALS